MSILRDVYSFGELQVISESTSNSPMRVRGLFQEAERVNGNKKLYRKLLGNFYTTNINTKSEIESALKSGETKLAERLVHTVKGVSATIGADELAAISEPLEGKLREGEDIEVSLWNDFWEHLDRLLDNLKHLQPEENKKPDLQIDYSKIKISQSTLDSMKKAVKDGMLLDLKEYFSELENIEPHGKQLVENIKELVTKFNDEGILKILEQIEHE